MKTLSTTSLLLSVILYTAACYADIHEKKIGIIVPMEHKAMIEIVTGMTDTLHHDIKEPLNIRVANAEGDLNLQRAIIQQMKDQHYDVVMPIATGTAQMTSAYIHEQPIVAVAANITEVERSTNKNCRTAIVHDEIKPQQLIDFIHRIYPEAKHFTLIHSASDKIFPDVDATVKAGREYHLTIKPLMVSSLSELYNITTVIPENTQGVIVLKDSLIISGINTLQIMANKRQIPLITSDQGSVQEGAAFALGVHERDIGVEAAKLAAAILAGKAPCDLPITEMTTLTVFINKRSLTAENQALAPIQQAAHQAGYSVEFVDQQEKSS